MSDVRTLFDFVCLSRLQRRWVLWHEFMKEHTHLDTWLRLAEQAVRSSNPTHVNYVTAKEELRKFEVRTSEDLLPFTWTDLTD